MCHVRHTRALLPFAAPHAIITILCHMPRHACGNGALEDSATHAGDDAGVLLLQTLAALVGLPRSNVAAGATSGGAAADVTFATCRPRRLTGM